MSVYANLPTLYFWTDFILAVEVQAKHDLKENPRTMAEVKKSESGIKDCSVFTNPDYSCKTSESISVVVVSGSC